MKKYSFILVLTVLLAFALPEKKKIKIFIAGDCTMQH